MVAKALKAAKELESTGKSITVVNNAFVNRPNTKILGDLLKSNGGKLVTLEDHQKIGGMGQMLVHNLCNDGHIPTSVHTLGVDGQFGRSAYLADHLYSKYGLSEDAVCKAFKD